MQKNLASFTTRLHTIALVLTEGSYRISISGRPGMAHPNMLAGFRTLVAIAPAGTTFRDAMGKPMSAKAVAEAIA